MYYVPLYTIERNDRCFVRIGKAWFYLPTIEQLQTRMVRLWHKNKSRSVPDWTDLVMQHIYSTELKFARSLDDQEARKAVADDLGIMIVMPRNGTRVIRPTPRILLDSARVVGVEGRKPAEFARLVMAELCPPR